MISDHRPSPPQERGLPGKTRLQSAERIRFQGHRGGIIRMHRALAHFVLEPLDLISSAFLAILFAVLWLLALPWVCRLWCAIFAEGSRLLALHPGLGLQRHRLATFPAFSIPYPQAPTVAPTPAVWWWTAGIVLALVIASFLMPAKWIPLKYLLRSVLAVQISALVFFAWLPARFPHSAPSYLEGLTSYGLALISAVPPLFGFTYYIFDFGLARKIFLTLITMLHLSLFIPLQVLAHAAALRVSVLFMPILYIVFGLPLDVLLIIAFYSWGMGWTARDTSVF